MSKLSGLRSVLEQIWAAKAGGQTMADASLLAKIEVGGPLTLDAALALVHTQIKDEEQRLAGIAKEVTELAMQKESSLNKESRP